MKAHMIRWKQSEAPHLRPIELVNGWLAKNADKDVKFICQSESVEGLGNHSITITFFYDEEKDE